MRDVIVELFKTKGFAWGDWDYYTCPNFPTLVEKSTALLSRVGKKSVDVKVNTSVRWIANYLVSIDKTESIDPQTRNHLATELQEMFRDVFAADCIQGVTTYSLYYCKKTSRL